MYISRRLYICIIIIIFCFLAGYHNIFMFTLAQILLLLLIIACIYDYSLLFKKTNKITAFRECEDRFSNGDSNQVKLHVDNTYPFPVSLDIVDEIPDIFQFRDILFHLELKKNENRALSYHLRPVKRGIYKFGQINILVFSRIGLLSRRFKSGNPQQVKVYPSYQRLRQYELMAISNKLSEHGLKRIRKVGQQLELEHIKEYVKGDDYRTINWKATARRHQLMVNVFQDERSQNVYNVIDKGRTMQSAFDNMTLFDYSINASLALSYVAMIKGDKAGLVTFEKQHDTLLPASRHADQMYKILESLYGQTTTFADSDFSSLYANIKKKITQRSLLLIYTNFDSVRAMQRQLTYLKMLAKHHTVIVIFFENTGITELVEKIPENKTEAYEKVIAEKLAYEKTLIINKLLQNNILSILSHPLALTPDVINKYLELKARNIS